MGNIFQLKQKHKIYMCVYIYIYTLIYNYNYKLPGLGINTQKLGILKKKTEE